MYVLCNLKTDQLFLILSNVCVHFLKLLRLTPKHPAASEKKPLEPRVAWWCLLKKRQRKVFKIKLLEFNFLYCLFLLKTYCDCSRDGHFILTCSNGFNGKGCEATVSDN